MLWFYSLPLHLISIHESRGLLDWWYQSNGKGEVVVNLGHGGCHGGGGGGWSGLVISRCMPPLGYQHKHLFVFSLRVSVIDKMHIRTPTWRKSQNVSNTGPARKKLLWRPRLAPCQCVAWLIPGHTRGLSKCRHAEESQCIWDWTLSVCSNGYTLCRIKLGSCWVFNPWCPREGLTLGMVVEESWAPTPWKMGYRGVSTWVGWSTALALPGYWWERPPFQRPETHTHTYLRLLGLNGPCSASSACQSLICKLG